MKKVSKYLKQVKLPNYCAPYSELPPCISTMNRADPVALASDYLNGEPKTKIGEKCSSDLQKYIQNSET